MGLLFIGLVVDVQNDDYTSENNMSFLICLDIILIILFLRVGLLLLLLSCVLYYYYPNYNFN